MKTLKVSARTDRFPFRPSLLFSSPPMATVLSRPLPPLSSAASERLVSCVQEKLVRYAAVDALEEREAVVATKEKAVGNVIEYEAVAKALKEEYEAKVSTTTCRRSFSRWPALLTSMRCCVVPGERGPGGGGGGCAEGGRGGFA